MMPLMTADAIPIEGLSNYGIAGIIGSIFLAFGWKVYNREKDKVDSLEKALELLRAEKDAEIKRLNDVIQEKYVPSMQTTTAALLKSNELLADLKTVRRKT